MSPELILQVFSHWKMTMGHERARMDVTRARTIRERMRDGYSVEDLCIAIDGCAASAFHQGENDRRQVYDSITLILRDADHVDKFIRAGEAAHKMLAARQERQEQVQAIEQRTITPPTEEEKARVAEMLRLTGVKLKSVALRKVA